MTKILKLLMRGFKSFATKTELVMGDNFNVVLGPNGSGKSNVLDAVCFVLGKGSAKGLRAEKSENLIYNGGKLKNPAKEAEVAIFFDNKDKEFPIDTDVVKVSRILKSRKAGSQSKYKINDKTRTRQQILDLLSVARIEPEGYNIILQGDITRFVEMSPVNRREIVEEIAGISVYEEKRTKALKELDKVELKMNEADIILTERKTHLKELKSDRDQAQKYKELEDKLESNKATLLDIQITDKKQKKAKIDSYIKNASSKVDKCQNEVSKLLKEIDEKKEKMQDISKEVEKKGEKEQVEMHKHIEQIKVDLATNKTRVGFCNNELERIEQRKQELKKNLEDLEENINGLDKDAISLKKRKQQKEKELAVVEKRIADFKKDHKLDSAGEVEKEIEKLDKEADDKQKALQELREKQQELLREKDRLELQIESVDEKITKVLEVEKEHKTELEKLKQNKTKFKEVTLELNKLLNEDSKTLAELSNARQKFQLSNEKLSRLRAESQGIKQSLAGSEAIGKILSNKNKFKGVHNTVSSLGNVSSKYALALEVAAGPRIKSLVVEDEEVASNCIKFLRKNRLGIATFLPMNKVKGKAEDGKLKSLSKANGVVGKAIDLIEFDPKFKNIFSYVFGNTLVVEDIDVARRLGVGEIRMVTLDGDLAEVSGAMHGGYRQRAKGIGFQEKEVMKDLEENEKHAADLESLVKRLEKKKAGIEDDVTKLRQEKAVLEGEIIKIEKSLHLDSGDIEASKKVKGEFREKLKDIDKDVDSITDNISSLNSELTEVKIKKQKMRAEMTELRSPTKLAELNTFEQKRSELKEEITVINNDIKNAGMQGEKIYGPEVENIQKIIKQHDKEEESFKEEIEKLKESIKKEEGELKEKEKSEKKFYAQFKELFTKRNKLNDEIQKIEKVIYQKEQKTKDVEMKVNSQNLDNARISAELAALEEEFSRYKDAKILKNKTEDDLRSELREFERMVEKMGSVNMRALEIYESVEKEYHKLLEKKKKLLVEKEDVMVMMNEIETKKKDLFMKTFDVVNEHFKNFFQMLTTKGQASMVLENPKDPFEEGVRIKVRISTKKFLDIRGLSGGEKTLTALAFIFSIQEHDPASFYILDEVDAALDKRNSEKLAKLVRKYCNRAQYVMISHNDGIISEADNLYGVSMNEHGISKVVSLKI